MIRLFTGQPGHGKTQFAIGEALKLLAEGRVVYAGNIKELDYEKTGFLPLDSFKDWESLPDGAVVLWDECYDAIGVHGSRKPPAHVEALARHRHRGFDFILVAQQAKQLDGFVSGLIEQHWHFRRKFGTQFVVIKKWDQWQRDAQKAKAMVTERRKLDPKLWAMYKSATVHTVKRQVPWYFFAVPIALVLGLTALYLIPKSLLARASAGKASQEQSVAAVDPTGRGPSPRNSRFDASDALRFTDPVAYMTPRIEGKPWTAPAYDDAPIGKPPRLACISSADRCLCLTADQGTRVEVSDRTCRVIVEEGSYDPTRTGTHQPAMAAPPSPPKRG